VCSSDLFVLSSGVQILRRVAALVTARESNSGLQAKKL